MRLQPAPIVSQDNIHHIGDAFEVGHYAGFLGKFAQCGLPGCFARFNMAARQTPDAGKRGLGALGDEHLAIAKYGATGGSTRPGALMGMRSIHGMDHYQ